MDGRRTQADRIVGSSTLFFFMLLLLVIDSMRHFRRASMFAPSVCVFIIKLSSGNLEVTFIYFYFFFLIQFYVPFKLFHSYRDESIGRWGENRSTRGKNT